MFEEYKKDLLKFYRIRKENHRLSVNLEEPGREKLRKECVEVFQQKNAQKDKDLIRSIFDPKRQHEDLERCIERYDLNKFRPLISFLTIPDRNIRNDRFVKLLAWLLDFPTHEEWKEFDEEERECIFEKAAKKHEEEEIEDQEDTLMDDEELNDEGDKEEDLNDDDNELDDDKDIEEDIHEPVYIRRFSSPQIIISCIILLFISSTSFMAWERMPTKVRTPSLGENSMYWDGDHYEPVKAGTQKAGVTIIPLDLTLLQQQRKITLPDTMTKYSLGKVWYKGYKDNHEYFTAAGVYPPDTLRTLKKFSLGILKDHISYYRYLFTRLLWFLCAAFLISLGGYLVSRLKKEVKQPEKERETDDAQSLSGLELAQ